jgi:hypothetical protein
MRRLTCTALGMARVTVRAVVNIVSDTSVVGVRGRLVVRVTRDAREHRVVRGIGMAVGTTGPSAGVRARVDREFRMRECGPCPSDGCMASLASGGECGGNVVRIGDPGVVSLVARIAIGRSAGVLARNMAKSTGNGGVCASERE